MKIIECQNHKAFSISIEKILIIGIVLGVVGFLAAFGGDLIGTASVVETMDASKQIFYADQEFVSITIKNSGNTPIKGIQAYVLIEDSIGTGANDASCKTGSQKAVITTGVRGDNKPGIVLNPSESVTISGDLHMIDRINTDNSIKLGFDITCGINGPGSSTAITTGTIASNDIEDRKEYIIQVDGISEGGEILTLATTVRAR